MPRPIVCPSCGRQGKLPDSFPGGKIRCPACGVISQIPAATARSLPAKNLGSPDRSSVFAEDDELEAAAPPPAQRRPVSVSTRKGAGGSAKGKTGDSSTKVALLTVGGVLAGLGLLVGLVVALRSGGRETPVAAAAPPTPSIDPAPTAPTVTPAPVFPTIVPVSDPQVPVTDSLADITRPTSTGPRNQAKGSESPAPTNTIQKIKDATVYVKVETSNGMGTGTGFVIRVQGDTALMATNHHVVAAGHEGDLPTTGPEAPKVTVVLRSGLGLALEQALPATVIADDSSQDLAILSVKGIKNPPEPIALGRRTDLIETMSVIIFGFPFGELLGSVRGNPAITINKGAISSLRMDEFNQIARVQIDGSINPGNSGGPVVDEQGRLVGVAVAKISNTNIGFAIPPQELVDVLDGRLAGVRFRLLGEQNGVAEVQVQAQVADPLNRVRGITLHFLAAAGDPQAQPDPSGHWAPLPNTGDMPLQRDQPQSATTRIRVPINGTTGRHIQFQMSYRNASESEYYTRPLAIDVPTSSGQVASTGDGNTPGAQNPDALTQEELGPLVDPSRDCQLQKDRQGLTISIPGRLHLNSPEFHSKNAPMALMDIKGDFAVQVKVPGKMQPGTQTVSKVPFTFQGAGLILWQDKDNYLRLERTAGTTGGLTLSHRVLVEACKNGKPAGHAYIDVPDVPLYLMLLRRDGALHCLFGPDGHRWIALEELALEFPDAIQVGVSAGNASKKPFEAHFTEFALIRGEVDIKEEKPQK